MGAKKKPRGEDGGRWKKEKAKGRKGKKPVRSVKRWNKSERPRRAMAVGKGKTKRKRGHS